MPNGLTPQEWEWMLREMEEALRRLWETLTPEQRRQVEEHFLRVWEAIRAARAAGAAGAVAAAQQIGAAMRGLVWRLARIGVPLEGLLARLIDILGRFVTLFGGEAAGGAVVGGGAAGGGAAATGGAASGGAAATGGAATAGGATLAATLGSVLIALVAIIIAAMSIYGEATTELELPAGGPPCGGSSRDGIEMATVNRAITVRAIGRRTSLNKAIVEAQKLCDADASKCGGRCPNGKRCVPRVSVQEWEQWYRVFWTTTRIVVRCPCECV